VFKDDEFRELRPDASIIQKLIDKSVAPSPVTKSSSCWQFFSSSIFRSLERAEESQWLEHIDDAARELEDRSTDLLHIDGPVQGNT